MRYCIDTSSVIDAGERHYPQDIFPAFWERMQVLVDQGRLKAPRMLITELEAKSDAWREWVHARSEHIVIPECAQMLENVGRVMSLYAERTHNLDRITGDPFFIACSMTHELTLITSEQPRRGNVKIPLLCRELGVKTVSILQLARDEHWSF